MSRAMRQAAQSLDRAQVPEDVFWYAQQVCLSLPMQASFLLAFPVAACACQSPMLNRYNKFRACVYLLSDAKGLPY